MVTAEPAGTLQRRRSGSERPTINSIDRDLRL